MSDQTPLDVEAIRAELAAMAGRPWTAEAAEYFIGRLLDENARLNAENTGLVEQVVSLKSASAEHVLVEGSWFKREDLPTVLGNFMRSSAEHAREAKALSARLTAKNAELDRCIREAAADKAQLAAKVEAANAKVAEWDLTDDQIDMIASDSSPVRRAEKWLKLTSYRVCAQSLKSALSDAAPEMPRPPAEEGAMAPDEETEDAIRGQHQTTVRGGNWVSLRCDCREWELEVPAGLDAMPRLKAAHAEHVAEMVAEGARLAAQKPVSGPETAGTGSGRGTEATEAPGAAQDGEEA